MPLAAQWTPEWVRSSSARDVGIPSLLARDGRGNITIAGTDPAALLLSQYTTAGSLRWQRDYPAEFIQPVIRMATSAAGEVWATLVSAPPGATAFTGTTIRLDAEGQLTWTRTVDGYSWASSVLALDEAGHAFVTGVVRTNGPSQPQESLHIVKYAPDGAVLWTRTYSPSAPHFLGLAGSAADPFGNLLVTGTATAPGGTAEFLTVKFDPDGALLWAAQENFGAAIALATALAVDSDGATAVTGMSIDRIQGMCTVLYAPTGERLWTVSRPPVVFSSAIGADVKFNGAHQVVVTGSESRQFDEEQDVDCVTVKYDLSGAELWSARSASRHRIPKSVAIDGSGAIGILGTEQVPDLQMYLLHYSADGDLASDWFTPRSRPGGVAFDSSNHIFVASTAVNLELQRHAWELAADRPVAAVSPRRGEVLAGAKFTFAVEAKGAGPFRYQWFRWGSLLHGATNATLTLTQVQIHDAGAYTVRIASPSGESLSPESFLTVNSPAGIGVPPFPVRVIAGRPATLVVQPTGDAPLSLQWQRDGMALPGETNGVLRWTSVSETDAGQYSVSVSNAFGAAVSVAVPMTVVPRSYADEWVWRHPLPQGNDLLCATYGDGHYVLGGKDGTLLFSEDGVHWTHQSREALGEVQALGFAKGRFVACSAHQGIFSSEDGLDWSQRSSNIGGQFSSLLAAPDLWLAVQRATLLRSTNGMDWTANPPLTAGSAIVDIAFGGDRFVAVNGEISLVSTNGDFWVGQNYAFSGAFFRRVLYGRDRFLVFRNSLPSTNVPPCAVSPDGRDWKPGTLPGNLVLHDVAVGPSLFVGLATDAGGTSYLCTSDDGLTWSPQSFTFRNEPIRVVYLNDRFFILGDDGGLWSSRNGTVWDSLGGASDLNLRAVAFGPDLSVAVGNDGTVMTAGPDKLWQERPAISRSNLRGVAYGNQRFVAVGGNGNVFHSTDSQFWTPATVSTNALHSVHFGNGRFLAVGDHGTILRSADGVGWDHAVSSVDGPLQCITSGGGWFVVAGTNGFAARSTDGLRWESTPIRIADIVVGLAYGNGRFMAVMAGGQVATSTDAAQWTMQTPFGASLQSVAFGAGEFVVVGNLGVVATSIDGAQWLSHESTCVNVLRQVAYSSLDGTFTAVGNNETILQSEAAAPRLRMASGRSLYTLTFWPLEGTLHWLQTSSDLRTWNDLLSFTGGPQEISVPAPPLPAGSTRFFRIRSGP